MYNDEALCPEKFEVMAKEYAQNKRQIEIKKIQNNNSQKKEIKDNINQTIALVLGLINFLSKFNLQNKNILYSLQGHANKIKKIIPSQDNLIKNINYCQSLVLCITNCTKALKQIIDLEKYCLSTEYSNYKNLQFVILDTIQTLSQMFGTCKYRKT